MLRFIDQMGREVLLQDVPKRIISVVPSHTELLFDLDLDSKIVGITKFCVHPSEKVRMVDKVGGTKKLDLKKIAALKPDLIIANKEENLKEEIEMLSSLFPVWISDIYTLEDALFMINETAKITGKINRAITICKDIKASFSLLKPLTHLSAGRKVAYFIWKEPYMVAGKNTFIDHVLQQAGFQNAFSAQRYPLADTVLIRQANPDLIFLSSEPYPFKEKHIEEFKKICPSATVMLVDGEIFSWYGSRLKYTGNYILENIFKKLNFRLEF